MGQKVGDGECYALADEALRSAGAASAPDFGRITPTADYKWSSQQVSPTDAKPGDIIQFRNSHITVKTEHADGSWEENTQDRPHHTAVVVSNGSSGNLTVLEQNVTIGGTAGQAQKSVRQNQISATAGTRKVGTDTVTVTITGTLVVYRPVAHP
jgi:cell wall-associated NlpC family hydrolase